MEAAVHLSSKALLSHDTKLFNHDGSKEKPTMPCCGFPSAACKRCRAGCAAAQSCPSAHPNLAPACSPFQHPCSPLQAGVVQRVVAVRQGGID